MVSSTSRAQLLIGEALAVITLAVLVIPWVISLHQTPTYEATAKMLVDQSSTDDTNPRIPLALQDLTLTVADVADTMPVAQAVVEQVNLPELSAREVLANTSAEPEPGTMFVNISYKDSDPQRAQLIANTIGEVLSEKISEVSVGDSVMTAEVWAPATLPQSPVSPNPVRNVLLALVTWGLLLGLLITVRASLGNPMRVPQKNVLPEYAAGEPSACPDEMIVDGLSCGS